MTASGGRVRLKTPDGKVVYGRIVLATDNHASVAVEFDDLPFFAGHGFFLHTALNKPILLLFRAANGYQDVATGRMCDVEFLPEGNA